MPVRTRLLWALAGFGAGLVASVIATGVVIAVGSHDLVPEVGSEVGRTTMQHARGEAFAAGRTSIPLVWLLVAQVPLWIGLIGAPLLARSGGLDWRTQLGWRMRPRDAGIGAVTGVVLQFVLIPLLYLPIFRLFGDLDVAEPARSLTDRVDGSFDVIVIAVMTIVGAPIAEEIFYRGLLQGALRDRLGPVAGVALASLLFAVSHFQLLQFPALMLVGVVHGLLVWRTGRLGPAVWSHVAFNTVTVIVLLWL